MRGGGALAAAALAVIAAIPGAFAADLQPLSILTAEGRRVEFQVEVADTNEERARGLMHRHELPREQGMLLWYRQPVQVRIWMKNTHVPLDIVFIDERGTVARVHPGAEPLSEATIPSGGEVRAVLEINAGLAGELGIGPGASVAFGSAWPDARDNP